MRPIISFLANTNSSFLNIVQSVYSTLVGISPNFTRVVQIRHAGVGIRITQSITRES